MRKREMEGEKHSLRNWASKSKTVKVAQSCPTPCFMDCSLSGSSVHGILQARILEGGCHFLLQGIFPTQGLNPGFLHCTRILYHQGNPKVRGKKDTISALMLYTI